MSKRQKNSESQEIEAEGCKGSLNESTRYKPTFFENVCKKRAEKRKGQRFFPKIKSPLDLKCPHSALSSKNSESQEIEAKGCKGSFNENTRYKPTVFEDVCKKRAEKHKKQRFFLNIKSPLDLKCSHSALLSKHSESQDIEAEGCKGSFNESTRYKPIFSEDVYKKRTEKRKKTKFFPTPLHLKYSHSASSSKNSESQEIKVEERLIRGKLFEKPVPNRFCATFIPQKKRKTDEGNIAFIENNSDFDSQEDEDIVCTDSSEEFRILEDIAKQSVRPENVIQEICSKIDTIRSSVKQDIAKLMANVDRQLLKLKEELKTAVQSSEKGKGTKQKKTHAKSDRGFPRLLRENVPEANLRVKVLKNLMQQQQNLMLHTTRGVDL